MFIHVFGDESPPAQQLTSLRETGLKNLRDLESCMRDQTLWGKFSVVFEASNGSTCKYVIYAFIIARLLA